MAPAHLNQCLKDTVTHMVKIHTAGSLIPARQHTGQEFRITDTHTEVLLPPLPHQSQTRGTGVSQS